MEGSLKEVGTAYPSRAPGFTPGFGGVRVAHLFSFLCCVLFVFVLCLVCPDVASVCGLFFLDCPWTIMGNGSHTTCM
jgi:hypothetical protein